MSGPPPGFSIPAGATGPPAGFPTSLLTAIPSGVIPSGVIPTGSPASSIMTGPPAGFTDTAPLYPGNMPSGNGPPAFILAKFNTPELQLLGRFSLGICWATCGLAIMIVASRLLTRSTKRGSFGWDDATIAVAVLLSIGGAVSNTFQHTSRLLSPAFTQATLASELLNFFTLGFMRLSVAIFCLRLLPRNAHYPKYAIWAAILLNFIATTMNVSFFAAANQFRSNGPPTNHPAMNTAFIAAGVISVIVDFITVLTPLTVVRNLQMKKSVKIGVMIIMSLSLLTASLSIGKVIVTANMDNVMQLPHNVRRIQILSNLEQNLGIIFASCPALRQLYGFAKTKIRSYYRSTSAGKSVGDTGGSGSGGSSKKPVLGASGASTGNGTRTGNTTRRDTEKSLGSVSSDTTTSVDSDRDLEKGSYTYLPTQYQGPKPTNPPVPLITTTAPNKNTNPSRSVTKRTSIEILTSARDAYERDHSSHSQNQGHGQSQGWDSGLNAGPLPPKEKAPSVTDGVDCAVERGRQGFRIGMATRKFGWLRGASAGHNSQEQGGLGVGTVGGSAVGDGSGAQRTMSGRERKERSTSADSNISWYRESRALP